jgi:hypothetical protein
VFELLSTAARFDLCSWRKAANKNKKAAQEARRITKGNNRHPRNQESLTPQRPQKAVTMRRKKRKRKGSTRRKRKVAHQTTTLTFAVFNTVVFNSSSGFGLGSRCTTATTATQRNL